MLYMGGHLPENTIDWPWVDDSTYLEPALRHASLMNKTLTDQEKSQRIKEYFKFMVVRNPLERLVSGYRNKLEAPVRCVRTVGPSIVATIGTRELGCCREVAITQGSYKPYPLEN